MAVAEQASAQCELEALVRLVEYFVMVPNEQSKKDKEAHKGKEKNMDVDLVHAEPLFNHHARTSKQFRLYKTAILTFVSHALSNRGFLDKLLKADVWTSSLEDGFLRLIEGILAASASIQHQEAQAHRLGSSDMTIGAAVHWRALQKSCYEVLEKTNGLLPIPTFVCVISRLLEHHNFAIRRKAISVVRSPRTRPNCSFRWSAI